MKATRQRKLYCLLHGIVSMLCGICLGKQLYAFFMVFFISFALLLFLFDPTAFAEKFRFHICSQ
jgi:hypothetical protein